MKKNMSQSEINQLIEKFELSNITQAEFSRRHGIHAKSLSRWISQKKKRELNSMKSFVPVEIHDKPVTSKYASSALTKMNSFSVSLNCSELFEFSTKIAFVGFKKLLGGIR